MRSRKKLKIGLWTALAISTFASGCSKNNLPLFVDLGDLRVLTIIADQPEANPGDTVTLTPVISDLNGGGRALSYSVVACLDPGIALGAPAACPAPDPTNSSSGAVTAPMDSSQTFTGAVTQTVPITLPDEATALADRNAADQYNGVAYLVFYTLSAPGGNVSVTSLKRIMISDPSKTPKNQNPGIASLNVNDSPTSSPIAAPGGTVNLSMTPSPSAAETYSVMQADGSLTQQVETLVTTWFISDGAVEYFRTIGTDENQWTPPSPLPSGRGMIILGVTRDERGGQAFQSLEMN